LHLNVQANIVIRRTCINVTSSERKLTDSNSALIVDDLVLVNADHDQS